LQPTAEAIIISFGLPGKGFFCLNILLFKEDSDSSGENIGKWGIELPNVQECDATGVQ
jgi:hypothetical protein